MLKKHDLLVDRLWIVEEIKLGDLVSDTLKRLAVAVEHRLLLGPLNVIKVEQVCVEDDLRAVVKQDAVRAI